MYIVDKNRDYYDYLSYIYGQDKKVTFDRRGSLNITDENIVGIIEAFKYSYRRKDKFYIILEIADVQYLIEISKIIIKDEVFKSCKMKLIYVFRNRIHLYNSMISIREVLVKTNWSWRKWNQETKLVLSDNYKDTITRVYEHHIDLPILAKTQITSLIPEEIIWKELQNYISSLNNDVDVDLPMTDVEKAEIHGFDKKTSFRHPIK